LRAGRWKPREKPRELWWKRGLFCPVFRAAWAIPNTPSLGVERASAVLG